MICCVYCNAEVGSARARDYHAGEARRILSELDGLGDGFAEDGVVKTVLRDRISHEKERS